MIILGSDHAGLLLKEKIKEYLVKKKMDVVDVGAYKEDENDNFSTFVLKIRTCFKNASDAKIIAVCGSGVGMNIGLNKTKGIRCVRGTNKSDVELARLHNNVNALSLGGRTTSFRKAKPIVDTFLSTTFLGEKYKRRMDEIEII